MTLEEIIDRAKLAQGGFALYRQPQAESFTYLAQFSPPSRWTEHTQTGFVVAPFVENDAVPRLIISAEERGEESIGCSPFLQCNATTDLQAGRTTYGKSFEQVHGALSQGHLQKVVLARQQIVHLQAMPPIVPFFKTACLQNPNAFVALWWTPQTGLWLTATPEVLLKKKGEHCHTMAVAGTMPLPSNDAPHLSVWSEKNKKEQQAVTDFIVQQLQEATEQIAVTEPYSYAVGQLMHLRTDIRFATTAPLSALVQRLHPTPAVCGVPYTDALNMILKAETTSRRYYSGFCGIVMPQQADLYVTLRCMELGDDCATLYAGGGILPESICDDEWDETCRKLRPMLSLFDLSES